MMNDFSPEAFLEQVHRASGADQSALYFFDAHFSTLLLCTTLGNSQSSNRYWRPYCADPETITHIQQSSQPLKLSGHPLTGHSEEIIAFPIISNQQVIGSILHCFVGTSPASLEPVSESVGPYDQQLFTGWIEFLVAEQSRPLPALLHIAGEISSSLDLDRVLLNVVEQGTVLFRAKMSSLMLINQETNELELVTAYGCSLDYLDKPNLPIEGSILGNVVKFNRVVTIPNIFKESSYLHKDLAHQEGVVSLLASPISFQNDVLGVLNIYSAAPRHWQRSEVELLQTFANHAAIAITNVRVHEQNLAMEEQLQESAKRATLGELAAGLAHEIRNPLAVINMLIHSWNSTPPSEDDFRHDVSVIAQKISDLNALVGDLLNLAKTRPLERQQQDISELLDRVLRLLRHRISKQRVSIQTNILTPNTIVPVDRERIEQVILNLLLNALDVSPEQSTIRIELDAIDHRLALKITDSGPGIPAGEVQEIFKAFHSNKPHGVGLGLPMTRRIVEEHKGSIEVTGHDPHGATFVVLLPYSINP